MSGTNQEQADPKKDAANQPGAMRHGAAFAIAAALALSVVLVLDFLWRDAIEANRREYRERLLKETLADIPHDRLDKTDLSALPAPVPVFVEAVWTAINSDGKNAAVAVRSSVRGYNDQIVFVAAFDMHGELQQSRIVRHAETPGVAGFLSEADGGARAIDGVSGATVTSTAVASAAREIGGWVRYNREFFFPDMQTLSPMTDP